MKIFLDSAHVNEVADLAQTGLVDGVTTNPSLIVKSGRKHEDVIADMCKIIDGPVSAEVTENDTEAMITQGIALSSIAPNVVVKVPLTVSGLRACIALRSKDIKVNVTLCFSAAQALLAAKAGASFISPFVGRLDDISMDGLNLIADITKIYKNYDFKTEILVASIRHPVHVTESARIGAHVVTLPPKIFKMLYKHQLTDIGLKAFMDDWKSANQ